MVTNTNISEPFLNGCMEDLFSNRFPFWSSSLSCNIVKKKSMINSNPHPQQYAYK